jgi:hypothetical protein
MAEANLLVEGREDHPRAGSPEVGAELEVARRERGVWRLYGYQQ